MPQTRPLAAAFCVLAAMGGAGWWLGRTNEEAPRLLAADAVPVEITLEESEFEAFSTPSAILTDLLIGDIE